MLITLVLKDGGLETLSLPSTEQAPIASASQPQQPIAPASSAGAGAPKPNRVHVSWNELLRELVSATHAFSVDESPKSTPVLVGKSLSPTSAGADGAAVPPALDLKANSSAAAAGSSANVDVKSAVAAAPATVAAPTSVLLAAPVQSSPAHGIRSVADMFHITYNDDEGDLITISNEGGLLEAYRLADAAQKELELSVTVLDTPPPLSSISFTAPNFAIVSSIASNTPAPATGASTSSTTTKPQPVPVPVATAAPTKASAAAFAPIPSAASASADVKKHADKPIGRANHAPVQVSAGALPDVKLNPILDSISSTVSSVGTATGLLPPPPSQPPAVLDGEEPFGASPFEAVYLKHSRRNLQAFESYFLNLTKDKYVKMTALKQKFAKLSPDTKHYALLKERHQSALNTINTRFQKSVELLVSEYDKYMSNQPLATFLFPLFVTISVDNRGLRVVDIPMRSVDTVADLRDALVEHTSKKVKKADGTSIPADPVVEFGPCSYFALRVPAADTKSGAGPMAAVAVPASGDIKQSSPNAAEQKKESSNGGGNFLDFLFGVPRKSSSASKPEQFVLRPLTDESQTMASLNIHSGAEFVLVGGVRRKSEAPRCVGGLFAPSNSSVQYFNCLDCQSDASAPADGTALCYGCAAHCHAGHRLVPTPAAEYPKPAPNMNGHALLTCPCTGAACRIRDPVPLPAALPQFTEELGMLRAMGFTDAAVSHLTMPTPLPPAPAPAPAAPIKSADVKSSGDSKSSSPVIAPKDGTAATVTPIIVPPAAAIVSVPAAPAPATTMPALIPVTLRALLQSNKGNVQACVDVLLGWEKKGLLRAPTKPPITPLASSGASVKSS